MACTAMVQAAGLTVNAGDTVSLTGATMDLECDDLVVNGTLDIAGTTLSRVGNVVIGAGGTLNASGASFQITRS